MATISTGASYGSVPVQQGEEESQSSAASLEQWGIEPSNRHDPTRLRRWGRWTGILYCVIIICGFAAELGVRGGMIDYEDADTTAQRIRANPSLFRQGLLLDVLMSISDVFVSILLALILLSAGASPVLSIASSLFRFLQQAVIANNLLHMFAASLLLERSLHPTMPVSSVVDDASSGNADIAAKWAFFFLHLHKYGYLLALVFFGISMVLLGVVIVLEGVFPHWLGVATVTAGAGYILDSLLYFLVGSYDGQATGILMLPVLVAEFGLAGVLLTETPQLAARKQD